MPEDNSYAGQGAVMLDIGGDVGALVVVMPKSMEGIEVEIRPVGAEHAHEAPAHEAHAHGDHTHDDHTHDDHTHDDHTHVDHAHDHASPWPHVAVVARPAPAGIIYSLVYPQLSEGSYELYVRPREPVELTVDINGGYVTEAVWPT